MSVSKKCRGCKRKLVESRCWPNDQKQGWAYLYCVNPKCPVLSTERQGGVA
jgi:hypothetical protein